MYRDLAWSKLHECFTLSALFLVCIVCRTVCSKELVPLEIRRREIGDIVYFDIERLTFDSCQGNETTSIVNERQCVSDEALLNDCMYALAPNASQMIHKIATFISDEPRDITSSVRSLFVFGTSGMDVAVITNRNHSQQTMSSRSISNCYISSLEVYRGSQQTYEINHKGFSLSSLGSIKIDKSGILYDIEELNAELYRMNISCTHNASLSGCVFFKVIGSYISNIANAKFGGSVPGTLQINGITVSANSTAHTAHPADVDLSGQNFATLDIITYVVIAMAMFLSLLFFTLLSATCYFYYRKTAKSNRRHS